MPEKKRAVLTPKRIFIHGVIVKNPVLVQVIGLCPAVAAAADLMSAAVLSALLLVTMILCECIASIMLKKVPRSVRVGIYFAIGLAVCVAGTLLLQDNLPQMLNMVGIYLPLMAASSAVALRAEKFAVKKSVHLSFLDAVANGVGASLVLLISGAVRELLGSGTILEYKVFATAPLRGLSMPFGGFIVLGFLAALLKRMISGKYDAGMDFGIEKRKKKKPTPQKPAENRKPAEPAPAPQEKPAEPQSQEKPDTGEEESTAADFYEQASEDPEEDLGDTLFDSTDLSVQEEMEAILEKIGSFEDILAETQEGDDNA